ADGSAHSRVITLDANSYRLRLADRGKNIMENRELFWLMRKGLSLICLVAVLFTLPKAYSQSVDAATYDLDIPARPMDEALVEFAKSTGITVLAPQNVTQGLQSQPLSGDYSVEQGLQILLGDSPLAVRRSSTGTYVVSKAVDSSTTEGESASPAPVQEEIIVHGSKRGLGIQDVTSSVAVWTDSMISDLTVTDLSDLYLFTPNVSATSDTEGEFSIRGINVFGVTFTGVANVASLYVDDFYQTQLGIEGGTSSVWDIDQVEIFRGPQSTIQGRNSLAGAIFVKTADPSYDWQAKARVEAAEYDTRRYAAAVGGPLVDDHLAFRLAVDKYDTDGYVENTLLDRNDVARDESLTARGKLLFDPTEQLSALFTYVYSEGEASTGLGAGAVNGPNFEDREVQADNHTLQDIETNSYGLRLGYELSENLSFEWINTYAEADETSDPRFPVTSTFSDTGTDKEELLTSELRMLLDYGKLNAVTGLYYFDEERNFTRLLIAPSLNFFQDSGGRTSVENVAAYLDGTYSVTEQLDVLFGGRWDREKFQTDSISNGVTLVADTDFDIFLPKAGLRYQLDEQQSLGFVVQKAYRGGGAALNDASEPYSFDEETVWNYELSYRSIWLDGRLSVNANIFYMEWDDQQFGVGDFPDFVVANVGRSTLFGGELDINWAATERLMLFGGVGINDTEIKDAGDGNDAIVGSEFAQSPGYQISLGALYNHESGFYGSIDGTYTDEQYSDLENSIENKIDSYYLFNAKLGYRAENWGFAVFSRNVFDEDYAVAISVNDPRGGEGGLGLMGAPRVVGAEVTLNM
ncbi:MAG: TonB-dependent receptor, partial [Pseudomonadota bacterium]